MTLEELINQTDEITENKVLPIINYIISTYKVTYDSKFSERTLIPTFRLGSSYVAIGCRKHYISIYFSNREAVNIITNNYIYCRGQKSCVNFSYKRDLPLEAICNAVDLCLASN